MKKQNFNLIESILITLILLLVSTLAFPLSLNNREKANRIKDMTNLKNLSFIFAIEKYYPRSLASYAQHTDASKDRMSYICPSTPTGKTIAKTIIPDENNGKTVADADWKQDYYYFTMKAGIAMKPKDGEDVSSAIRIPDFLGFNIMSSFMGNHINYGNILDSTGSVSPVEDKEWYKTGVWADIVKEDITGEKDNALYKEIEADKDMLKRPAE